VGDWKTVCQSWATDGYCLVPRFLSPESISHYRQMADRVYAQWWEATFGVGTRARASNMATLTDPVYWQGHREALTDLLELIAHPQILDMLTSWHGQTPLFHNTQYFVEQQAGAWDGEWHRDTQFLAAEPQVELARMQAGTGVHVRFAFEPDACFQIVPGSRTIAMQPGDMLIFHAWSVHRGRYAPAPPRRTLDIIYQATGICDYCPPPPTCLTDPTVLATLSPQAQAFFERFATAYGPYWERGEVGF
jgi:hypothetical protein